MISLNLVISLLLFSPISSTDSKVRVNCYIRKLWPAFPYKQVASQCSHVTYFFAEIKNSKVSPIDGNEVEIYNSLMKLKDENPSVKVLIAIGRWNNADARTFSSVADDTEMRTYLARSVLEFVRAYKFDGVLLNWQDPADKVRGRPADFKNYVLLVRDIRAQFNGTNYELSASGSPFRTFVRKGYNVKELSQLLDAIEIRTLLFYSAKNFHLGHTSPLRSDQNNQSVEAAVQLWIEYGAEPSKLAIVVPFFGSKQEMANETNYSPYADAVSRTKLELPSIQDICRMKTLTNEVYVDQWSAPVMVNGSQYVSYENEESLSRKVAFVKKLGLSGLAILSLERDDFDGSACNNGVLPLLSSVASQVRCSKNEVNSIVCPDEKVLKQPNDLASVCVNYETWPIFVNRSCVPPMVTTEMTTLMTDPTTTETTERSTRPQWVPMTPSTTSPPDVTTAETEVSTSPTAEDVTTSQTVTEVIVTEEMPTTESSSTSEPTSTESITFRPNRFYESSTTQSSTTDDSDEEEPDQSMPTTGNGEFPTTLSKNGSEANGTLFHPVSDRKVLAEVPFAVLSGSGFVIITLGVLYHFRRQLVRH
ncbi:Chitotriosidase-1 [Halotydeus destructor]|nr:Chitotriosidase-1 [Halotydeus destructor]